MPLITGKPEQQSGVLTSISRRQHNAFSGCPLPEQNLDPQSADPSMPQLDTLWPSPRTIFYSAYYQVLTAIQLPTLEGWKVELA